ncbi:hypothetical protein CBOM_07632 [Ceraceosorus bombacis]|uniref:Uncharacterized protein n=1 Tax=Ceraceosorus bombacis TaxID=401625 RepID=A0A0P1B8S1_9BASI|nr:hypothetical protein CBOM_07632 [Ceraceosorus bombacis]
MRDLSPYFQHHPPLSSTRASPRRLLSTAPHIHLIRLQTLLSICGLDKFDETPASFIAHRSSFQDTKLGHLELILPAPASLRTPETFEA